MSYKTNAVNMSSIAADYHCFDAIPDSFICFAASSQACTQLYELLLLVPMLNIPSPKQNDRAQRKYNDCGPWCIGRSCEEENCKSISQQIILGASG